MRKIFRKLNENIMLCWKKMTLKQKIRLFAALVVLDVVLVTLCIISIVEWVTLLREDEVAYTYAYATERGHSITGTLGQWLDGDHYVIDETVIFGPYSEKPALKIPLADSDIVIDTSNMSFAQDTIGGFGNGIYSCRKEQRFWLNRDTLVYAGLARYEDGEIYIYIQFLQKIENLGGTSYVSNELWRRKSENGFTDEEQNEIAMVDKIEEQGIKDFCLYPPSALDDVMAGTATIKYNVDHLDLIGYDLE